MIIAGLTGSIGMGKSTAGKKFRDLGAALLDSDQVVHQLYSQGGLAVGPVSKAFPEALKDGAIDRSALSAAVIGQPEALKKLEAIVHPLVKQEQQRFIARARAEGRKLVVLDIPLLFETGAEKRVDHVIVVTAPAAIQASRVLERPGMTEGKFKYILTQQIPDAEKRRRADTIIDTSGEIAATGRYIAEIYQKLINMKSSDA